MKNSLALRMKYPDIKIPQQKRTAEVSAPVATEGTLFDAAVDTPYYNKVENYYKNIEPTLTARESLVFDVIGKIGPCTMHEVAECLKVPLNTISGRFSALVEKGFVRVNSRKDRKSLYHKFTNPNRSSK